MERLNSMSSEREQLYSDKFNKTINKAKEIFGNHSKGAATWIGGPFNEVRHQHIPGYKGHVRGLIAENIHGNSFAQCSARAIYLQKVEKPKNRF